jgi:hypothetical protein
MIGEGELKEKRATFRGILTKQLKKEGRVWLMMSLISNVVHLVLMHVWVWTE